MAEDKSKKQKEEAKSNEGGWLKLPKMWSDSGDKSESDKSDADLSDEDKTLEASIKSDGGSTADDPLLRADAPAVATTSTAPAGSTPAPIAAAPVSPLPVVPPPPFDFEEMKVEMERMNRLVNELNERESSNGAGLQHAAFGVDGLQKRFHLRAFEASVRPLLFLYDSLEQFDREVELYERPNTDERRQSGLAPRLVRENIGYFREQLVEGAPHLRSNFDGNSSRAVCVSPT